MSEDTIINTANKLKKAINSRLVLDRSICAIHSNAALRMDGHLTSDYGADPDKRGGFNGSSQH